MELAEKAGDLDEVKARQEEVAGHWEKVDEEYIKPILDSVPEDIRNIVQQSLFSTDATPEDVENEDQSAAEAPEKPAEETTQPQESGADQPKDDQPFVMDPRQRLILDTTKAVKAAYIKARRAYRAPASRIARLQEALDRYVGTPNFHNYTIQKTFKDPSAKRHIKSFKVNTTPVVINGTEWLSLKVHGQSFMMHQIRKMVAMASLVVRCGCHPDRIKDSYGPDRIAIPKAPGLGLLLERPIFDSYNAKASSLGRGPVHFERFTKEMDEFKQREIYDRIFREEEQTSAYVALIPLKDLYLITDICVADLATSSTTSITSRTTSSYIAHPVVLRLRSLCLLLLKRAPPRNQTRQRRTRARLWLKLNLHPRTRVICRMVGRKAVDEYGLPFVLLTILRKEDV